MVDLPLPLEPSSAIISPALTSSDALFSALTASKFLLIPVISSKEYPSNSANLSDAAAQPAAGRLNGFFKEKS